MTPYFQIKIREMIQKAEEEYNIHKFMGWRTDFQVEWRHLLLKSLLKDQLKNFARD